MVLYTGENKLCATCTSLILTKLHPIFGYDAGNQPPAPDLEARRSVVATVYTGIVLYTVALPVLLMVYSATVVLALYNSTNTVYAYTGML